MAVELAAGGTNAEVARRLGIEYREGFYKNRYVGRTFIMPGQAVRKKSVRQKLNAIGMEFQGKNVLIVDEICTSGETLRLAQNALRQVKPADLRTATSLIKQGGYKPDFYALETDATVIFPWDRQVVNDEGEIVNVAGGAPIDGVPFTEETVTRMLTAEPMASPGAACLSLAWQHRAHLLGL